MKLKTVRQFSISICDVSVRHSHYIRHGGISNIARAVLFMILLGISDKKDPLTALFTRNRTEGSLKARSVEIR